MGPIQLAIEALIIGSPSVLAIIAVFLYGHRFGNWRNNRAGKAFMLLLVALAVIFTVNLVFNLLPVFGVRLEVVSAVWAEVGSWLLLTAAYVNLIVAMARTPADKRRDQKPTLKSRR